jgi:hypothetical protein
MKHAVSGSALARKTSRPPAPAALAIVAPPIVYTPDGTLPDRAEIANPPTVIAPKAARPVFL